MLVPSELSFFAILGASVVGSIHCSIMCLPIAASLRSADLRKYHIGRLFSYLVIGTAIFYIGKNFDENGYLRFIAGTVFLMFFSYSIIKEHTKSGCGKIHGAKNKTRNGFVVGLLSALMPCAWLWGMLFFLTQTKNSIHLLFFIFVFWVGTLPIFKFLIFRKKIVEIFSVLRIKSIRIALIFILSLISILIHFYGFRNNMNIQEPLICLPKPLS